MLLRTAGQMKDLMKFTPSHFLTSSPIDTKTWSFSLILAKMSSPRSANSLTAFILPLIPLCSLLTGASLPIMSMPISLKTATFFSSVSKISMLLAFSTVMSAIYPTLWMYPFPIFFPVLSLQKNISTLTGPPTIASSAKMFPLISWMIPPPSTTLPFISEAG